MLQKKKIEAAVIQMFRVNLGIQPGEKILILSDIPTRSDWKEKNQAEIEKMHSITYLGKAVAEIARSAFRRCTVDFYPYFSIG